MHNLSDLKKISIPVARLGRKLIQVDFVRFCLVGAVGFLVNLSALFLLYDLANFSIVVAQLIGAECALFSNFTFHHFWTYKGLGVQKRKRLLLAQYHLSFWSGAAINSLIVVLLVSVMHAHYFIGLIVGSAVALFWNFFWTKFFIWKGPSEKIT